MAINISTIKTTRTFYVHLYTVSVQYPLIYICRTSSNCNTKNIFKRARNYARIEMDTDFITICYTVKKEKERNGLLQNKNSPRQQAAKKDKSSFSGIIVSHSKLSNSITVIKQCCSLI